MPTSGTSAVRARTAASSAARRAGCSIGLDRTRRIDARRHVGHAASRLSNRGFDGRGRLRRPDGSIDTGMPITSRRASPHRSAVVRRPPVVATKRPKRPAAERRVLDAISGPSILSAPSGKTYGTGGGSGGSTRLSTKSGEPETAPSTSCRRLWTACGEAPPGGPPPQPPIANISILGRVEVAAERSSE